MDENTNKDSMAYIVVKIGAALGENDKLSLSIMRIKKSFLNDTRGIHYKSYSLSSLLQNHVLVSDEQYLTASYSMPINSLSLQNHQRQPLDTICLPLDASLLIDINSQTFMMEMCEPLDLEFFEGYCTDIVNLILETNLKTSCFELEARAESIKFTIRSFDCICSELLAKTNERVLIDSLGLATWLIGSLKIYVTHLESLKNYLNQIEKIQSFKEGQQTQQQKQQPRRDSTRNLIFDQFANLFWLLKLKQIINEVESNRLCSLDVLTSHVRQLRQALFEKTLLPRLKLFRNQLETLKKELSTGILDHLDDQQFSEIERECQSLYSVWNEAANHSHEDELAIYAAIKNECRELLESGNKSESALLDSSTLMASSVVTVDDVMQYNTIISGLRRKLAEKNAENAQLHHQIDSLSQVLAIERGRANRMAAARTVTTTTTAVVVSSMSSSDQK
jgi:hypothetical protein